MAGIRGAIDPTPTKGDKPTGIFSTRGSQKKDPCTAGHEGMTASKYRHSKVDPKARDNGLKK